MLLKVKNPTEYYFFTFYFLLLTFYFLPDTASILPRRLNGSGQYFEQYVSELLCICFQISIPSLVMIDW